MSESLLTGNGLNLVAAGLSTLSLALTSLLFYSVARFLFSFGAGMSMCSLVLFLQETSPTSMRGLMSFCAEMAFVLTNAIGGFAGCCPLECEC